MNSFYLMGIILVGFVAYFLLRDRIFGSEESEEAFEVPAPSSIEVRQAPLYPPRTIVSSGPQAPSQAPENEIVVHGEPSATDPYHESQESSDIPEHLRHPERSFRSPPLNDSTSLAIPSGIASERLQVSADNSQQFQQEFIQGGGEFMPGIFANDTFHDTSFSTF